MSVDRYVMFVLLVVYEKQVCSKFRTLPPATKLGKGYIFTGVCDSVHGGGWSGLVGGAWSRGSGPGGVPGLGGCLVETPQDGYCCGQYASYWNVFLSFTVEEIG